MAVAPILSWEELGLIQGSGWLFRDLDLFIGPRDRLALIGRNGVGKTTLLRLIANQIEAGLATPGAVDVTARHRSGPRLVSFDGSPYLLPTIVLCESADHPLANREFLFPFAAIVGVQSDEMRRMPEPLGKTLALTALTADRRIIDSLLASPLVDRLNAGAIQTNQISWDQPHEGNLFEHLYARRSFQTAERLATPALAGS